MLGGAGFIGSNLTRALIAEGEEVEVVDNFSRGKVAHIKDLDVKVVLADLSDYSQTRDSLKGIDCVYHLAARIGSIEYLHGRSDSELDALQTNISLDVNVIRACKELRIKKIVYGSSVAVYPMSHQMVDGYVLKEEEIDPISPEGGYGLSKMIGERQLAYSDFMPSAIARIFSTYGEFSDYGARAQVVSALVRKAILYPKEEFVVWGDGSQKVNLTYVGDCVDALLKLRHHVAYPPLVVNVGSQDMITVRELASKIIELSGKSITPKFELGKPVSPPGRVPYLGRVYHQLGWKPRTSLDFGLSRTYNWIKKELTSGFGQ